MSGRIEVRRKGAGYGLFALKQFQPKELLFTFEQSFVSKPTNKTLRVDLDLHQLSTNPDLPENFLNHSCDPTAYIGWSALELRAMRNISIDEEITYNYLTSDWDGEDIFDCLCAARACKGRIAGFKKLSEKEREMLKPYLSPFLLKNFLN
ncbi:MAG: SET domain-containing protein-lysine N-methyltransferase [Patescibacteria group bacterium]